MSSTAFLADVDAPGKPPVTPVKVQMVYLYGAVAREQILETGPIGPSWAICDDLTGPPMVVYPC